MKEKAEEAVRLKGVAKFRSAAMGLRNVTRLQKAATSAATPLTFSFSVEKFTRPGHMPKSPRSPVPIAMIKKPLLPSPPNSILHVVQRQADVVPLHKHRNLVAPTMPLPTKTQMAQVSQLDI